MHASLHAGMHARLPLHACMQPNCGTRLTVHNQHLPSAQPRRPPTRLRTRPRRRPTWPPIRPLTPPPRPPEPTHAARVVTILIPSPKRGNIVGVLLPADPATAAGGGSGGAAAGARAALQLVPLDPRLPRCLVAPGSLDGLPEDIRWARQGGARGLVLNAAARLDGAPLAWRGAGPRVRTCGRGGDARACPRRARAPRCTAPRAAATLPHAQDRALPRERRGTHLCVREPERVARRRGRPALHRARRRGARRRHRGRHRGAARCQRGPHRGVLARSARVPAADAVAGDGRRPRRAARPAVGGGRGWGGVGGWGCCGGGAGRGPATSRQARPLSCRPRRGAARRFK